MRFMLAGKVKDLIRVAAVFDDPKIKADRFETVTAGESLFGKSFDWWDKLDGVAIVENEKVVRVEPHKD